VNKSESIKELAKALAYAQAELKNPVFDSNNPHFKSKYASLAAVRDTVIPTLSKHGLTLTQWPLYVDGHAGCRSFLAHSSGEWMEETLLIPIDKQNAHGVGSATTYSRRFSMMAIAGVVGDEDDDGNGAVDKPAAKKTEPDPAGKEALEACGSINSLQAAWMLLTPAQRATLGHVKDAMKERILDADRAAAVA
jgi:hypothetical protein